MSTRGRWALRWPRPSRATIQPLGTERTLPLPRPTPLRKRSRCSAGSADDAPIRKRRRKTKSSRSCHPAQLALEGGATSTTQKWAHRLARGRTEGNFQLLCDQRLLQFDSVDRAPLLGSTLQPCRGQSAITRRTQQPTTSNWLWMVAARLVAEAQAEKKGGPGPKVAWYKKPVWTEIQEDETAQTLCAKLDLTRRYFE